MQQLMMWYGQRFDLQTKLMNQHAFQAALADMLRNRPGRPRNRADLDRRAESSPRVCAVGIKRRGRPGGPYRRLPAFGRGSDALLGRFGARCFLVAMPASKADAADRARIQMTVDALEPMRVLGTEIRPEIAAGVAYYPSDSSSCRRFDSVSRAWPPLAPAA